MLLIVDDFHVRILGRNGEVSLEDENLRSGHISYKAVLITQERNEEGMIWSRTGRNGRKV